MQKKSQYRNAEHEIYIRNRDFEVNAFKKIICEEHKMFVRKHEPPSINTDQSLSKGGEQIIINSLKCQ